MWVCKEYFLRTLRIRAKPWKLVVCHILDALLGDEPSLTGTVFYVCISDSMLDFYIYAFWRGCILGSSVSLEQLLGDGVQRYIDSYEELALTSILSGIDPLSFISKGGANILDCYGHLVRDEFIHCCSRRCRLCDSKTALQSMVQFGALTLLDESSNESED